MEKRIASLGDALLEINPEIKFTYLGNDYDTLQILSNHEKPTQKDIESAKVKAQQKIDDNFYKIQRAEAYPRWQDQLDKIFHNGIDAWKADIQAIKDQFPKP